MKTFAKGFVNVPGTSPAGVPVFRWLEDEVKVMYEYPQGFPLKPVICGH